MNKRQRVEAEILRLRLAANVQVLPYFCTLREAVPEDAGKEVFEIKGKSMDGSRMELALTTAKGTGPFFFKEWSDDGFMLGKVGDSFDVGTQAWLVEDRTEKTFYIKRKTLTEADRGHWAYSM